LIKGQFQGEVLTKLEQLREHLQQLLGRCTIKG